MAIRYSTLLSDVTSVLFAVWFHDIVYDPTAADNELLSVDIWQLFIKHLQYEFFDGNNNQLQELQEKVSLFIRATIKHEILSSATKEIENDMKWFLDFDLSILGCDRETYMQYARDIRQEYIHIQSPVFEEKRAKVMTKFLNRKMLFFTKEVQKERNEIALDNIQAEINQLLNN